MTKIDTTTQLYNKYLYNKLGCRTCEWSVVEEMSQLSDSAICRISKLSLQLGSRTTGLYVHTQSNTFISNDIVLSGVGR